MLKKFTFFLLFTICATSAHSAIVAAFEETGSDVTLTVSGSLDVDGLPFSTGGASSDGTAVMSRSPDSFEIIANGGPARLFTLTEANYPVTPSVTSTIVFGTGTGDLFAQVRSTDGRDLLFLPQAYASGEALSSRATFVNESFATLGLTTGTFESKVGTGDTVTFYVGVAPPMAVIPLPATLPLALVGFGALGLLRKRHRA